MTSGVVDHLSVDLIQASIEIQTWPVSCSRQLLPHTLVASFSHRFSCSFRHDYVTLPALPALRRMCSPK